MSTKVQRTLAPAQFESFMDFADSLKNGSNNSTIDEFKYKFAVREGYIRPRKAQLEAVDGLNADSIKDAINGLLGAFLPHLDDSEKCIVGKVMENLNKACAEGRCPTMDDMFGTDDDEDVADDVIVVDGDEDESGDGDDTADADEPKNDESAKDDAGKDDAGCEDGKCDNKANSAEPETECCCCKDGKCVCGKCNAVANSAPAETECGAKPKFESASDNIPEDGNFWMALGKVTRERGKLSEDEMARISSRFRRMGSMKEYEDFIRSCITDNPSGDEIDDAALRQSAESEVAGVLSDADSKMGTADGPEDYERYAKEILGLTDRDF